MTTLTVIDKTCRYNLTELPSPVVAITRKGDDGSVENPTTAYIWSGAFPVPARGEKVFVNMNGFGSGTVHSYFLEHGWLGVRVVLDVDPEWHVKQSKGTKYEGSALVFGAELKA